MQRRNFLKNTGVLTGSILVGSSLHGMQRVDGPVRIGVIGCGDRGRGIMDLLGSVPDLFQVVAISDVLDFQLVAALKVAGNRKCDTYVDYQELLKDRKVEAVIIATPLNMHYPIAVAVINSGRHLYLEKTMTYNIKQALELVQLMKARPKQVLQVGHQYRYSPLYYRVKEMVAKGYLGKITQVDCRWDRNGDWRRKVPTPSLERAVNWRMYKAYSGGLVAELLSHQIDFINWLFDTHPDEFLATGGIDVFKDGRETFDNVQVILRYTTLGLVANFGAMCGNAHDGYLFKIKGTLGTVSLLMDQGLFFPEKKILAEMETIDGVTGASRVIWNQGGGSAILSTPTKDGTLYAFEDFYKRIKSGTQPDSNVVTGARTAICVHLANQALYDKQILFWNPDHML